MSSDNAMTDTSIYNNKTNEEIGKEKFMNSIKEFVKNIKEDYKYVITEYNKNLIIKNVPNENKTYLCQ